jgi:large conductance mechanosensitive channel
MSMLQEFKAFAMRGSVVDLAVGVVIGAAFGKIVSSLVEQIIMPPIGMLTGGVDFSSMKWVLKPGDDSDPKHKIAEVAIGYGAFINTIITFLIIAAAIFLVVKAINSMQKKPAETPATPADVALLTEIRDLLKARPLDRP